VEGTPGARVSAAVAILDRGWGKPPQFTTGDEVALKRAIEMTDDELATSIEAAKRELGISETESDPDRQAYREAQTKLKNPYSLPCRYLMAGEWREEANEQATDGKIAFDSASEDRARVVPRLRLPSWAIVYF
jgi:hypothetical protein